MPVGVRARGPAFIILNGLGKVLMHFLSAAILTSVSVQAATGTVERVTFKDGVVTIVQGGKTLPATNDFALTGEIAVMTNGTFAVQKGEARRFRNGDSLGADGMLTAANGSITPVMDHIVLKSGRPVLVKDGHPSPLTRDQILGDGTRIQPDATVIAPNGLRSRLQDGQLLRLDGTALPVKDTVLWQGGKVKLFKDGTSFTLQPNQSIAMSDGTKILGDGTLIRFDGSRLRLKEGEILTLEGVPPPKR